MLQPEEHLSTGSESLSQVARRRRSHIEVASKTLQGDMACRCHNRLRSVTFHVTPRHKSAPRGVWSPPDPCELHNSGCLRHAKVQAAERLEMCKAAARHGAELQQGHQHQGKRVRDTH